jgi:hypothetical protein
LADSFLETASKIVPGRTGPKFVLNDNSEVRIGTIALVDHGISPISAKITGLESELVSTRGIEVRSEIVNMALSGVHTGTWMDDNIEETPAEIPGHADFSCVFFKMNHELKLKPKPMKIVIKIIKIPDITIKLNDDTINQLFSSMREQGKLSTECTPTRKLPPGR